MSSFTVSHVTCAPVAPCACFLKIHIDVRLSTGDHCCSRGSCIWRNKSGKSTCLRRERFQQRRLRVPSVSPELGSLLRDGFPVSRFASGAFYKLFEVNKMIMLNKSDAGSPPRGPGAFLPRLSDSEAMQIVSECQRSRKPGKHAHTTMLTVNGA